MKTPSIIALFLLAALGVAPARDVTFHWDANPPDEEVTRYRLYLYDAETDAWIPVQDAADDPATPELDPPLTLRLPAFPDAETRVRLTAINVHGLESPPSEEILVRMPPGRPTGLRYTVQLTGELTLTPVPE